MEIVYIDKASKITQRRIEVKVIKDGRIRATCLTTGAPRVFLAANVLAWRPISQAAG
ncbi:hypothetical protein [Paenibacillus rhizophilus]|uniref:hypothetical protein n=1 Tax=Paenibacillus rhizophilus TaxID=1850366 RepID=UPI003CCC81ED